MKPPFGNTIFARLITADECDSLGRTDPVLLATALEGFTLTLGVITTVAAKNADADGCTVEFVEGDELVYAPLSSLTPTLHGARIPIAGTFTGMCVATATPILVDDVRTDPRATNPSYAVKLGAISIVAEPILIDGQVVGAVKMLSSRPGHFNARHSELIALLAGNITSVLLLARFTLRDMAALA